MSLLQDLLPASFRGIPFLIRANSTTFGGKVIVNQYPSSNVTYAEGIGSMRRTYNITAVISGPNYLIQRQALMAAIEDTSIGIYTDPFDGIRSVVPLPSTLIESQTSLGECNINITLQESDLPINPTTSGDLFSKILAAINKFDDAMKNVFERVFQVSSFFPNNFVAAQAAVNSINDVFTGLKTTLGASGDTTNLNAQQQTFSNNTVAYIKSPVLLANAVSDMFGIANNASEDPKFTAQSFQTMFGYGAKQYPIPIPQCGESQQRLFNALIIIYSINLYALAYAYLNYAQSIFDDDQELEAVYQLLDTQYLSIINGQVSPLIDMPASDVLDDATLDAIQEMRNIARKQFNKDDFYISKIVDINILNQNSASILSYMYYGNMGQDEAIISLNEVCNVSFVSGDLSVRTEAGT